jgi:AcrR family transcriptional regulator
MPTPTRILRTLCEELDPSMHDRTIREESQFQRILKCAPALLTFYNIDRITFTALATAMKMAPATLRKHFVDIPALLGYLIREHLREINAAISTIRHGTPNQFQLRRAAYLTATRKPLGAHTEIHLLMLNNLANLPDDVRLPLLEFQAQLAAALAPPGQAEFVLSMIENPYITPSRLEAIIATPESAWHETAFEPTAEAAEAPAPLTIPTPKRPPLPHINPAALETTDPDELAAFHISAASAALHRAVSGPPRLQTA